MKRKFPIDVDRDLEERIAEMQEQVREIAKEMRELIRKVDRFEITNEELEEKLKELREKLHGVREEFDKDVMQPMDELAKLFPLLILQEQFSQIVLRQRNLSDRLKSLADQEEVEDVATKRRMRDLAEEQGSLEDALDEVLLDIEQEALSLPIGEEYVELRDSSIKFSADVLASGALEQQEQAETALNELSGPMGFVMRRRLRRFWSRLLNKHKTLKNKLSRLACNAFNLSKECGGQSWVIRLLR